MSAKPSLINRCAEPRPSSSESPAKIRKQKKFFTRALPGQLARNTGMGGCQVRRGDRPASSLSLLDRACNARWRLAIERSALHAARVDGPCFFKHLGKADQ